MRTMWAGVVAIALTIVCGSALSAVVIASPEEDQKPPAQVVSKLMADGNEWTTANLNVDTSSSYCYDGVEGNCRRYGRLYTWASARQGCQSLGDGWRLPTDEEWRELARHYGGIGNDSPGTGNAAYTALLSGGASGFNGVLGGNRTADGKYERLDAHGFYWTASENDLNTAPFYNFGKGRGALYRQGAGGKQMAISVRCVRRERVTRYQ